MMGGGGGAGYQGGFTQELKASQEARQPHRRQPLGNLLRSLPLFSLKNLMFQVGAQTVKELGILDQRQDMHSMLCSKKLAIIIMGTMTTSI
jgi:hypothetical protein